MRLTDSEFRGMNNPLRRFLQRRLEFPIFKWLGLHAEGQDILENAARRRLRTRICWSPLGALSLAVRFTPLCQNLITDFRIIAKPTRGPATPDSGDRSIPSGR